MEENQKQPLQTDSTSVVPQVQNSAPAPQPTQEGQPKKVSKVKWFFIGFFTAVLLGIVTLVILPILAVLVLTSVNPGKQFGQARDTQRQSDLLQISNAVYEYAAKNAGELPPGLPTKETCIGTKPPCYDLAKWVVPDLLEDFPIDPNASDMTDTGYSIFVDIDGRVIARAEGEIDPDIEIQR